jgi:hypothetical protein
MLNWLISVAVLVLFCVPAFADYDFNGSIVLPVTVSAGANGTKTIAFKIKVNNSGTTTYSGPLHIKPFLLATDLKGANGQTQQGAVLDTFVGNNITVPAQGSVTVDYSSTLPFLRLANYELAAFINNDQTIVETNTLDDITDMVDVNSLSVTGSAVHPGGFDLTGAFDGDITLELGGAADLLRTIVLGPENAFPAESLWARFMLADMKTKHIFTAPYINYGDSGHATCLNQPNTDKNWFAISYHPEMDTDGNTVYVDYYNQAPCFEDTPPGDYVFVELLNSRDLVQEFDIHNDINAQTLSIQPISRDSKSPEIWFTSSNTPALTQAFSFHANYMKKNLWHSAIAAPASFTGLGSDINTGTVGGINGIPTGQTMNLTLNTAGLTANAEGTLNITSTDYPVTQSFPIKYFYFSPGTAPVATLPTAVAVNMPKKPGQINGSFVIRNDGPSPMTWLATPENSFVYLGTSSGTVPPKSEVTLSFIVDSTKVNNNGPGGTPSINLLTNSEITTHNIPLNLVWQ